jgi:hypothetical protein
MTSFTFPNEAARKEKSAKDVDSHCEHQIPPSQSGLSWKIAASIQAER